MPRALDMTPSWNITMQILIAALEDGTPDGKHLAREELMRVARFLDSLTEHLTK